MVSPPLSLPSSSSCKATSPTKNPSSNKLFFCMLPHKSTWGEKEASKRNPILILPSHPHHHSIGSVSNDWINTKRLFESSIIVHNVCMSYTQSTSMGLQLRGKWHHWTILDLYFTWKVQRSQLEPSRTKQWSSNQGCRSTIPTGITNDFPDRFAKGMKRIKS